MKRSPAAELVRYNSVAMVLHWIVAALILVNILLAWNFRSVTAPVRHLIVPLHESIGLTVLLLGVTRFAWRLFHPSPAFDLYMARWEKGFAYLVHGCFYGFMILMPLTGWLVASTWTPPRPLLWWGMSFPYFPSHPISDAHTVQNKAASLHEWLACGFYVLFALHLCGALKHQFWDGRDEFARMVPFPISRLPSRSTSKQAM